MKGRDTCEKTTESTVSWLEVGTDDLEEKAVRRGQEDLT